MKTNAIPMVMVALIGIFIFALIVSAETVEGIDVGGNAAVAHPLTTICVTPDAVTLLVGKTHQFQAKGYDKDGNEIPITPTWSTTGGEIDPGGLYTATDEGVFTVTASVDDSDVTGIATVHVTPPELDTIEVTPYDAALILSYVVSQQFNANGYDEDGNEIPITPTWSTTGGEITPDGLYTPTEEGDFTVIASVVDSDVTGSATVHVTPPELDTIEVTPDGVSLEVGKTQLFEATGYDEDGNEILEISFTWSTTGGEITPDGLYTATEVGGFTVTASVDDSDVTGSADVFVVKLKPPELAGPPPYDFAGPSHPGPLPYVATVPDTESMPPGPAPYP